MTKENLLNMKLHQRNQFDDYTEVLRVFGGWIYIFRHAHTNEENAIIFVSEIVNVEYR